MCCKGFIKRIVPFFLTFAAGLFVASFFVSVAAPNFSFRSDRGYYRFGEIQRLRIENRELRENNFRQRRQTMNADASDVFGAVPPVDVDVPPPPPPPRAPRFVK
jgi:hypothetical protein